MFNPVFILLLLDSLLSQLSVSWWSLTFEQKIVLDVLFPWSKFYSATFLVQ